MNDNLYLSVEHWRKQLSDQQTYIQKLLHRKQAKSVTNRFNEVIDSANARKEQIKQMIHILTYTQ